MTETLYRTRILPYRLRDKMKLEIILIASLVTCVLTINTQNISFASGKHHLGTTSATTTTTTKANQNGSLSPIEQWGLGEQRAQFNYEDKFFSVKAPASGFGAPQSGDVNLTWTFSPAPTIDIHSPYTQGYYKFYGINENYTKTHNISDVVIVVSRSDLLSHQFDSDPVISVSGEQLVFNNGTKITVPADSIDLQYGVLLK